jgi:hypothetical protein
MILLELFPKYPLIFNSKCFEFLSSTFHHRRRSADIKLLEWSNMFRGDPVSDISSRMSSSIFTRQVWYIRKVLEFSSNWLDLISIKNIYKLSHAKDKCDRSTHQSSIDTAEHLTIERSKSCTRPDETLGYRSITEDEVSKWDHPRKYLTYLGITDHRTPFTIGNTLDHEREWVESEWGNRIGSIESWSELEHSILSWFWCFFCYIRTTIDKFIDIMCELFFGYESELSFEHIQYRWEILKQVQDDNIKISPIMERFWFFTNIFRQLSGK